MNKLEINRLIFKEVSERQLPVSLAIAMMANAGGESHHDFKARQGGRHKELTDSEFLSLNKGGTGYGLFQFDGGQGKKAAYKAWADRNNLDYGAESQIQFVLDDIQGKLGEGDGVDIGTTMGHGNRKKFLAALPALDRDFKGAIAVFAQEYEKAGTMKGTPTQITEEIDRRVEHAPDNNMLVEIAGSVAPYRPTDDEVLSSSLDYAIDPTGYIIDTHPGKMKRPISSPKR